MQGRSSFLGPPTEKMVSRANGAHLAGLVGSHFTDQCSVRSDLTWLEVTSNLVMELCHASPQISSSQWKV